MNIDTDYRAAMSSIIPGTFSPDIASSNDPLTQPLDGTAGVSGVSFKDTVKSMLSDVNDKMATSDQLSTDLATGKTNDVNKVVTSVEEANLSMQFTLAIRNKLLDAYTEISRMQM